MVDKFLASLLQNNNIDFDCASGVVAQGLVGDWYCS